MIDGIRFRFFRQLCFQCSYFGALTNLRSRGSKAIRSPCKLGDSCLGGKGTFHAVEDVRQGNGLREHGIREGVLDVQSSSDVHGRDACDKASKA